MKKSSDVIVLNGRRYDAHTGKPLDGGAEYAAPRAAHRAPVHSTAAIKPVRHHESAHRPHRAPARPVAAHTPEHSRTLMRQTVRRPEDSSKRRLKVQGRLSAGGRESSKILTRPDARRPNTGRLQNPSTKREKGRLISHFSPELFAVDGHRPAITYGAAPVRSTAGRPQTPPVAKSWTTDELLEYAVQNAGMPEQPAARRRRGPFLRRGHAHRH
ncbi:MAG: hypothetical protein ACREJM_05290 [Candidatus Saccharimonadales bacterium]